MLGDGNGNYLQPLCSGSGNGRVLDISRKGGALATGQNVQIWTKDSPKEDQSQLWYIFYGSVENSFRFSPKYNTNFDLATNSMSRGTTGGNTAASPGNVYIETSNYSNLYQDWYLELLSAPDPVTPLGEATGIINGGEYYIRNAQSGKYLDVRGGTTSVWQYQFNNTNNQIWTINYINGFYTLTPNCDLNKRLDVAINGLKRMEQTMPEYGTAMVRTCSIGILNWQSREIAVIIM